MRVAEGCGKGTIRCPYHGQRFDYEHKVRHHEFGEFVFLPSFLGASKFLSEFSVADEFCEMRTPVKAPFHLWIQNTMDTHHLNAIHGKTFGKLFDSQLPENVNISEFESSFTVRIKDEICDKYAKYGDPDSDLFKSGWTHYMGFPNLSVTSFLGIFQSVESVEPTPDGGCMVSTRFFAGPKVPKLLKQMAMTANHAILNEDAAIVERWARSYKQGSECEWLPGESRISAYAQEIKARGLG
jgi:phenylpropionate dioxygenase-like ring-hydroxylating dioxygenase large terminal subunit